MNSVYHRPRKTRISWIFTYLRVSVSSVQSVFHCTPSAFIMPKPCGFSTPRTRMPAGIRGHALQRRDSGRHHLRLIFVSLSDRIQEMSLSGLDIGCQKNNLIKLSKSTQRAQSVAIEVFASFALFAVRFINNLNELSSSSQSSVILFLKPLMVDAKQ